MNGVQFGDQLVSLHTRIFRQGAWHRLKGLGKLFDGVLLQTGTRLAKNIQNTLLKNTSGHGTFF